MKQVVSPKTAAIAACLEKNGYSKDNPFIPSKKTIIHYFIELPTKYVLNYPYALF